MSTWAEPHFARPFCNTFDDVLIMTRKLFQSEDLNSLRFVLGGSETLGWDFVATNFVEPGESVLCLSTEYLHAALVVVYMDTSTGVLMLLKPLSDLLKSRFARDTVHRRWCSQRWNRGSPFRQVEYRHRCHRVTESNRLSSRSKHHHSLRTWARTSRSKESTSHNLVRQRTEMATNHAEL